jgi:hypothetical protein
MLASHSLALLSGAPLAAERPAPAPKITLQQIDANGLAALRRNDAAKLCLAVEATSRSGPRYRHGLEGFSPEQDDCEGWT